MCSLTVRHYLINYARTLIYTTALPASCLASIKVAYDFLRSEQAEKLRKRLQSLTKLAHSLLLTISSLPRVPRELFRVVSELPESPIIPLFTSHPRSLASHCQKQGFIVRPIVAPTVRKGTERVRICLHAMNTRTQVEGLVKCVHKWVTKVQSADNGISEPYKSHL